MLFNLLDDPVLLFEEVHLVEDHVFSLLCSVEIIHERISTFLNILIVEHFLHLFQKDFMPDFLGEYLLDCFLYFFKLKALLELISYFLAELFFLALLYIETVYLFEETEPNLINVAYYPHCHTVESGIHVLDHILNVRLVLCDKLKHFPVLLFKRPESQFFNFPCFDLVYSHELFIMLLMIFEEAGFTDHPGGFFAKRVEADIHDVFALVSFDEAFGSHRPFGFVYFFEEFVGRFQLRREGLLILDDLLFYFGE